MVCIMSKPEQWRRKGISVGLDDDGYRMKVYFHSEGGHVLYSDDMGVGIIQEAILQERYERIPEPDPPTVNNAENRMMLAQKIIDTFDHDDMVRYIKDVMCKKFITDHDDFYKTWQAWMDE
jgi:hypothetical protein